MSKKGKLGTFVIGAAIGAGLGVLFAPRSGKDTRALLKTKMDDLLEKAKETNISDVEKAVKAKITELKKQIAELDKETILAEAKKQAKKVKKLADDLVDYTKEQGAIVLEKAAEAVRLKAIDVTKDVLKRLESKK